MQEQRFSYLFEQYFKRQGSKAEVEELMQLIHSGDFDGQLKVLVDQYYENFIPSQSPLSAAQENQILNAVLNTKSEALTSEILASSILTPTTLVPATTLKIRSGRKRWAWIAIAASVAICLGTGFFAYENYTYKKEQEFAANLIGPGSNKARLVLSNGKVILLDTLKNGGLTLENGVELTKTKDGQLIYRIKGTGNGDAQSINTIETPKGGQYEVQLPDGTEVWLNAASSLKYSNAFNGKKREVTLNGEAYFEVAHRENQPFVVHTPQQSVEVLGTHFNVNAYSDEDQQVITLLEGLVKTTSKSQSLLLKPGQQSVLNLHNDRLKMKAADLETVMAWKNGDFIFKDEDLASVMKKVERWYDVEVVFEDIDPKTIQLGGWVSRSKNISAVIKIIEPIAGVKIKIDGRRITVMK
ncbi:FecR domain-containing protein [Pedobacter sp. N36a]|uniref:FecR family protein n=1 Tax=Pedobacter sp. N36a TaxID=2767996 RepID=UPI001656DE34|nr:FecR family protein [Pedobacter sp. N36a]MBC8988223.1 FecR domain-containing protein [Pedobacter sp. N36a]